MEFSAINSSTSTIDPQQSNSVDIDNPQLLVFAQKFGNQTQQLVSFQQTMYKTAFETWKNLTQTQINTAIDFFQLSTEQSLSARERLGIITEYQLRRLHEIKTFEHGLTLDTAEIFHAQTGAVQEQVAGMWPPALNLHNK